MFKLKSASGFSPFKTASGHDDKIEKVKKTTTTIPKSKKVKLSLPGLKNNKIQVSEDEKAKQFNDYVNRKAKLHKKYIFPDQKGFKHDRGFKIPTKIDKIDDFPEEEDDEIEDFDEAPIIISKEEALKNAQREFEEAAQKLTKKTKHHEHFEKHKKSEHKEKEQEEAGNFVQFKAKKTNEDSESEGSDKDVKKWRADIKKWAKANNVPKHLQPRISKHKNGPLVPKDKRTTVPFAPEIQPPPFVPNQGHHRPYGKNPS